MPRPGSSASCSKWLGWPLHESRPSTATTRSSTSRTWPRSSTLSKRRAGLGSSAADRALRTTADPRALCQYCLVPLTRSIDEWPVSVRRLWTGHSAPPARRSQERAADIFLRQGWAVDWSGQGSVKEIQARWSQTTLREALARDAEVDLKKLRAMATDRAAALRRFVTSEPIDPSNVSAAAAASQNVIDLKQRRHSINSELAPFRPSIRTTNTSTSLGDRIRTATDVHRLKTTGVGRRRISVPNVPPRTRSGPSA